MKEFFKIIQKNNVSPFWTLAIHSGHELRSEVEKEIVLTENQRLREEDPFTDEFTNISKNRIIVNRSRFEVDLNRIRKKAVYMRPQDAWGLEIWKNKPDKELISISLELYDIFFPENLGIAKKSPQETRLFFAL
ncbi:MAG: N-formylglutamate amidohydrolase [Candidatus Cloacimonetes bacterium]|nr:N-formylglutamate amidohydrolase [Candidatus Cloacimonadota bacterium]